MTNNLHSLEARLQTVLQRISDASNRHGRHADSVTLLAVSKTRSSDELRALAAIGVKRFGENYLQEALEKIDALQDLSLEWHFIGPIQSNKTRPIAENFDWVHSVDRLKIAIRLNEQRPDDLPPLNICLQVNISGEHSKSGATLDELPSLAEQIATLPRIKLRGLMAIPAPTDDVEEQHQTFRKMHEALLQLNAYGLGLDTLSMGMSDDLEAAIAEGATIVRIGTALFGPRQQKSNIPVQ